MNERFIANCHIPLFYQKAAFDGHILDDWRFANDLCRGLEIRWLDGIIIQADNVWQYETVAL
jgi:hypothetical protein